LVIDDEENYRVLARDILARHFNVLTASDGEEGVRLARNTRPDLILLDILMPKLDGVAACEMLRSYEATRHIPVIMVSGTGSANQRLSAFSAGADDFISKPFSASELLVRVQSKIRRVSEGGLEKRTLRAGNLVLDCELCEACIAGKPVALTKTELKLLRAFLEHRNTLLTREWFLKAVWNDCVVSDRNVDTQIMSLRKKLKGFDRAIRTVYGSGYLLKDEEQK
jgi:two-component system phosphate regulon response regulator PhoB